MLAFLLCLLPLLVGSNTGPTSASTGPTSIIHVKMARFEPLPHRAASILRTVQLRQQSLPASFSLLETTGSTSSPRSPSVLPNETVRMQTSITNDKHLAVYYSTMYVDGVPFQVMFDTGSCELWIPSDECNTPLCKRHHRYPSSPGRSTTTTTAGRVSARNNANNNKSGYVTGRPARQFDNHPTFIMESPSMSSLLLETMAIVRDDASHRGQEAGILEKEEGNMLEKEEGKEFNIQYISGRVFGQLTEKTISIGTLQIQATIGLASVVDVSLLNEVVWDGILGLAYPALSASSSSTSSSSQHVGFFDRLMAAQVLPNNQFAYFINAAGGTMSFGGPDCQLLSPFASATPSLAPLPSSQSSSSCIDQFTFVPVVDKTYWTVRLLDIRVHFAGNSLFPASSTSVLGSCPPSGCKAIIDTGTYLNYGPVDHVRRMLAAFSSPSDASNASVNGVHCQELQHLPSISFVVAGEHGRDEVTLTLHPHDYVLYFDDVGQQETKADSGQLKRDCVVSICPDKDSHFWTLGQVFLRSYYTLFDRDLDRIGFAITSPLPSSSSPLRTRHRSRGSSDSDRGSQRPGGREHSDTISRFLSARDSAADVARVGSSSRNHPLSPLLLR